MQHLLLISLLLLAPIVAIAADVTLPPPTEVRDTPEAKENVSPPAPAASAESEAAADTAEEAVEVRSHLRESDRALIEEYSLHGQVYMVKVQPKGAPAYYLVDRNGNGVFERLPGGYKRISPPMWVIKRF